MKKLLNKKIFYILIFLIQFFNIFGILEQTHATTTTISYVGTATDIGGGSFVWVNPNNAIGDTTTTFARSTISTRNVNTNNFSLTNFKLATAGLPVNAIIKGIRVNVERNVSNINIRDTTVRLTKDGTTGIGNNNAKNVNGSTTKSITTYGSAIDLWGTTWTATDLLSANFGVLLQYMYTKTGTQSVSVYRVNIIVDYNTPPTNIILSNNNINEGLPVASNIGTLSTVDPDVGDTHSYSFTCSVPGIDDASFAITGSNLNSNAVFNFDIKSSYNICLRTNDAKGGIFDKNFIININNINQTPTNIILSNNSIFEGLPVASNIGTLSTVDPDVGDTHSYSFTCSVPGIDDTSFAIASSNLNSNAIFNFAIKSIYNICIRTSDGNGGIFDKNFIININQQIVGPGGVSSGLQIWLKSNVGTSTSIDGNPLVTWNDQSGNGFNAGGGVSPIYRNNITNDLNYYPLIDFNGTTQYLQNLSNGAYTNSYFMVIVPTNQVNGTITGQVPFGFDCNSGILNTGTCGLAFAGVTLGAFTAAINDEVITHAIGSSTSYRSAQIGAASYQASKPMLIGVNENVGATSTDIYEKGIKVDNYAVNTYQKLSTADYSLGKTLDPVNTFFYNGKIAEVINFSGRIGDVDRIKIESYLSLKYGITLKIGTQNYIASDGITNYWSTSTAGVYNNDIFGIGRDNLATLTQVKSKSINDDNIIVLEAVGEGTNMLPSFVDISDKEFLTISNNNAGNTWTNVNAPIGYNILTRAWKVQETGEVGTINLDIDVGNVNFDVPALVSGTSYYFIYDTNNNNILSDDTPQIMTNIGGNIWRIAGFNLNHDREFTIATQSSSNNIPSNILLSNNTINENLPIGTIIGNLSTIDADILDTHTYTFVSGAGDTDNSIFTILGNILSINESPDYEIQDIYNIRIQTDDGNGGQFQKTFTIYINNIGETINSIIDFETAGKYNVTSGIWTRTTNNPNQLLYSIESNNLGLINTQSCFEIINTFPAVGTITFDYNVSSQLNGDYLRFYIDNIDTQNWSGTIPWSTYLKNNINAGTHSYKWCYIKDGATNAGTDQAFVDYITFTNTAIDNTAPLISSTNFLSGSLLPGGNHNIIINYSDLESGININSDIIALYKWNGTGWGSDISSTGLNLGAKTITATVATYPTNNLIFGKYMYNFQISDNSTNSSSTGAVFYIDIPELIVNTGSLDIGNLSTGAVNFSTNEIVITVKTIGALFQVESSQDTSLSSSKGIIINWNGIEGFGYDFTPYTGINKNINLNKVIVNQIKNINTNGDKNSYTYNIKIGNLINLEQVAGDYEANLSFYLYLYY